LEFDQESSALPLSYNLGLAYNLYKPWLLALEGVYHKEADFYWSAGSEYKLQFSKLAMAFRGGYTSRTRDVPGLSGLSLGLGWALNLIQLDYAWIPLGEIDQTHRISLTLGFGATPERTVTQLKNLSQPKKRRLVYLLNPETSPFVRVNGRIILKPVKPMVFIIREEE